MNNTECNHSYRFLMGSLDGKQRACICDKCKDVHYSGISSQKLRETQAKVELGLFVEDRER